jgi:hypothetical protein
MRECKIKEYFSGGIAERISWATRKDAVGFNYQAKLGWFVDHLRGIHGCLLDVGCNVGNLAYFGDSERRYHCQSLLLAARKRQD